MKNIRAFVRFFCLFGSLLLSGMAATAQGVGIGTLAPNAAAALEIQSTTQGLLLPRLTLLQRQAIATPVAGLLVFQTDGTAGLYFHNGSSWRLVNDFEATNIVSTLAGDGSTGALDGPGGSASFFNPCGVAVDGAGTVYVADQVNSKIRSITPAGVVSTLAGTGTSGYADGLAAAAQFSFPTGVAVDGAGTVYVADGGNHCIRRITGGVVSTLAGSTTPGFTNATGAAAQFSQPFGLALNAAGLLYVADTGNHAIRTVTTPGGVVGTLAGNGTASFAEGLGAAAGFSNPYSVAVGGTGTVYVADGGNNRIRQVTPAGLVSTLAGTGAASSNNGPVATATFNTPTGMGLDATGRVVVVEVNSYRVRAISTAGLVSTVAGSGVVGFNDAPGTAAQFSSIFGVAVTPAGIIHVSDTGNQRVRTVK